MHKRSTSVMVGQVPAVVSRVQFDEVQAKLATNRPYARRNNTAHRYLLRALVSCGCCGLACRGRSNGRYAYYCCAGKRQSTYSRHAVCCSARQAPVGQLDELVWRLFHEEEEVRVLPPVALTRGCRCSPDYIASVLARFPVEEQKDMAGEDGLIRVDCEFCATSFPIEMAKVAPSA